MKIFLIDRVENTVGKGENAGYQHFLLLPQCFPKHPFLGSLKLGLCGKELKIDFNETPFHQNIFQQGSESVFITCSPELSLSNSKEL